MTWRGKGQETGSHFLEHMHMHREPKLQIDSVWWTMNIGTKMVKSLSLLQRSTEHLVLIVSQWVANIPCGASLS